MATGWKGQKKELTLPVSAVEMTSVVCGGGHAPQPGGAIRSREICTMQLRARLGETLNACKVLFQKLNSQFQTPGPSPGSRSDSDQRRGVSSQAGIKCACFPPKQQWELFLSIVLKNKYSVHENRQYLLPKSFPKGRKGKIPLDYLLKQENTNYRQTTFL